MLLLPAGLIAIKGRHLHQPYLPLPKGEYVISKLYPFFILIIYRAFLQLTPYVYLFLSFFFLLPWQSKHKKDTSTTRLILLDEPKFKVHIFPLHASSLPHIVMCFLSLLSLACLFIPSLP